MHLHFLVRLYYYTADTCLEFEFRKRDRLASNRCRHVQTDSARIWKLDVAFFLPPCVNLNSSLSKRGQISGKDL